MRYTTSMAVNFINEVSDVSSTLIKKDIIKKYYDSFKDEFISFLNDILSQNIKFGIDKKTLSDERVFSYSGKENESELSELISYLKNNNTSSSFAKEIAISFLASYRDDESYYGTIKNILLRTPRAGIDSKIVNTALGFIAVKQYQVQLASPFRGFQGVSIIEPKIDGVRCTIHMFSPENVVLTTRNGKQISGYDELELEIRKLLIDNPSRIGYVLDGEIISNNFDETMEGLFRKSSNKKCKYCAWDIIPIEEFDGLECKRKLSSRKETLELLFSEEHTQSQVISVIKHTFVDESNITEEHIKNVNLGYEGSIIKDINSFYEYKRSFAWQKMKDFHTDDFIVTEIQEGDGKYVGMLGALFIDVNGVSVKVGSGFTDQQRETIWNNPRYYIGKYIEVEYQEVTRDKSLRFPVFKRFRFDK